jgi:hypothetical protein
MIIRHPAYRGGAGFRVPGAGVQVGVDLEHRPAAVPGFSDPRARHHDYLWISTVTISFEQGGPSSGSPSYSDYWTGSFAAAVKAAVSFEG